MRNVTAQSVLEGVLNREGGGNVSPDDARLVAKIFEYIADRLRTAWEFFPWLEVFETEKRYFRAEYDDGETYAADAEIYFNDGETSGYFTPVADDLPAAGESPATDPDKWTRLTSLRRVVAFDQAGKTAFEGVAAAWDRDPDADKEAVAIDYVLAGDGVVIPPGACLDFVWLKIIKKCPDFAAVLFDESETYGAGRVVYVEPHCWEVLEETEAGETPGTDPEKFRQLEFPYVLARAVKQGALADWQRSDGEAEKAEAGESRFYAELEAQKWKLIGTQKQRGRIRFKA